MSRRIFMLLGLIGLSQWAVNGSAAAGGDEPVFATRIAPLLVRNCLGCHNPADRRGGLDLSSFEAARRGGESGPALVAGDRGASLLWQRVQRGEMPPEDPLPAAERKLLGEWIAAGAAWGFGALDPLRFTTDKRAGLDWWAWQPLGETGSQALVGRAAGSLAADAARNPIDLFVLVRLQEKGIQLAAPADRRTLIRRLYFDLLGLPPPYDEVERFTTDPAADAYEQLVERLLASYHYGERWARHWLDVARFGESQGFERDRLRSNSWRYRDWVIAALNADMPYDRFARQQLAGDVLAPKDASALVATGFLVAGPYDEVGNNQQSDAMKAVVRQDELEDLVSVVGQTFLGLTVNCARCHDHKFDPIRQTEYYQLSAALSGVRHGQPELPADSQLLGSPPERGWVDARIRVLQQRIDAVTDSLPLPARGLGQQPAPEISAPARRTLLSAEDRAVYDRLLTELEQLKSQRERQLETTVYAVAPRAPQVTRVLLRGNPATEGESVAAGGVAAVRGLSADFGISADAGDAQRRMSLANWIANRHNPLFARVIVNRLWHHHFGVGLVDTPNDFGFNGGRPSHPLLLDWLARELIRNQWSLKSVHRLILNSSVYRQASHLREAALAVDAENRLLWRKAPSRLEAEAIRDAILRVAGELNESVYGPGFHDFRTFTSNSQFYEMRDPVGPTFHRRSLYRTWARSGRSHFLDVFDCPDPSAKAPRRAVTITPLQALSLKNNSFVTRMAARFAERVRREVGGEPAAQVTRAYQHALGRPPENDEMRITAAFVEQHGLALLGRVIFNTNEFLFVD